MMLNIPPEPGQKRPTLRAYSMASDANDSAGFSFLVKLVPGGLGSEYLNSKCEGDELQFTGPFGKLLFLEPPTSQVMMICTGAGLSQHLSFLLTHGPRFTETKFRLLVGVWNEKEIFHEPLLKSLKTKIKNFDFQFCLDKAEKSWSGLKGYVTDHLESFDCINDRTTIYLCGNPAMINGVTDKLKAGGMKPEQILAEAFS